MDRKESFINLHFNEGTFLCPFILIILRAMHLKVNTKMCDVLKFDG